MNNKNITILKGDIVFSKNKDELAIFQNHYIIVENNLVSQITKQIPQQYSDILITDCSNKLIIPGFVDLHTHAPQFENIGLGLDEQLLPWLEKYTFPQEAKFKSTNYATLVYEKFAQKLVDYGTTRSVIFSSVHKNSTETLIEILQNKGLCAFVGKVNMDQNSSKELEESTKESLEQTKQLLEKYPQSGKVRPIVTPRFVPTCSSELLGALGQLAKHFDAPVQSHLSENFGEIQWVKQLHPQAIDYADVYDKYGLFGQQKTVMAHCIHNTQREIDLMKKQGVFVAHCPTSNSNLVSGIAPVSKYLSENLQVGLGSDVSGGNTLNMCEVFVATMQASRLYTSCIDEKTLPLSFAQCFYMATKGGGEFFGENVGDFNVGSEFDALVVSTERTSTVEPISTLEKLQKFIYSSDSQSAIEHVYVCGQLIK